MNFLDIFGKVYIASGVKGIYGDGYWYDKIFKLIPGYNFSGSTFIAKTVTIDSRKGNLQKKLFPDCIKIYPFTGAMMNSVGIQNPGLENVLKTGIWQKRTKPFLISIAPVRNIHIKRISEINQAVCLLNKFKHTFKTNVGIQLNVSCPNVNISYKTYISEIKDYLKILKWSALNMPIDLKINIFFPIKYLEKLESFVDIITCSNTIPFGSGVDINWNKYRGLEKYGGGGLSGTLLRDFVKDWVNKASKITDIKACGGIMCTDDVNIMVDAGAKAIEIGTAKLLRPWRIKSIIKRANLLFKIK